jgi:hypothetical protein
MRYFPLALAIMLVAGCAYSDLILDDRYQNAVDCLNDNPLVHKALKDHDVAVIHAEEKYRKAVEVAGSEALIAELMTEHQKRLEDLKTECVAALRRAEAATRPLNKTEADDIAWVADHIANSSWNKRFVRAVVYE